MITGQDHRSHTGPRAGAGRPGKPPPTRPNPRAAQRTSGFASASRRRRASAYTPDEGGVIMSRTGWSAWSGSLTWTPRGVAAGTAAHQRPRAWPRGQLGPATGRAELVQRSPEVGWYFGVARQQRHGGDGHQQVAGDGAQCGVPGAPSRSRSRPTSTAVTAAMTEPASMMKYSGCERRWCPDGRSRAGWADRRHEGHQTDADEADRRQGQADTTYAEANRSGRGRALEHPSRPPSVTPATIVPVSKPGRLE